MKKTFSNPFKRRGFMLILSSPSGAGKTTIARNILKFDPEVALSVSVTTRPKRPSEIDGKDYYFVDDATFREMVEKGMFLEHALVHDYSYGTPKASIKELLSEGKDVLFDIDWQGTQQLKQTALNDLVSIFILPPSMEKLEERLWQRSEDAEEIMVKRLNKAKDEISHWAEYDYTLINDSLEDCIHAARAIIRAERLKRRRQIGLVDFVKGLNDER